MRSLFFCFLLSPVLFAQYNADYKKVAHKHIRSFSYYTDTTHIKKSVMSFDRKGRITRIERYVGATLMFKAEYDTVGHQTLDLYYGDTYLTDSLDWISEHGLTHFPAGVYWRTYWKNNTTNDTLNYIRMKYDSAGYVIFRETISDNICETCDKKAFKQRVEVQYDRLNLPTRIKSTFLENEKISDTLVSYIVYDSLSRPQCWIINGNASVTFNYTALLPDLIQVYYKDIRYEEMRSGLSLDTAGHEWNSYYVENGRYYAGPLGYEGNADDRDLFEILFEYYYGFNCRSERDFKQLKSYGDDCGIPCFFEAYEYYK